MKMIALVTGSTSGIGLATAKKLSKNHIVIINDNKGIDDKFIKDNFEDKEVYYFKADISNSNDLESLKSFILQKFGRLDMVAAHAGIIPLPCDIDNITPENIDKTINVNLIGTFNVTRNVIPLMIKQKSGRIINISSVVGVVGNAGQTNYSASKAGIIGFTKSLAKEVASRNILVNAVAPGFIATDMTSVLSDSVKENINNQIPLRKMGTAEDVAKVVSFLASEDSSYITGQVINVDGGMVM